MPPPNLRSPARKKLAMLHSAGKLEDLRIPPGNRLALLHRDRKASTASGSMTNSASALSGRMETPSMWR